MRSFLILLILTVYFATLFSQNLPQRPVFIEKVNDIIHMAQDKKWFQKDDRSFNLDPDSILVTYGESFGQGQKASYDISYSHNKIDQILFIPDITSNIRYKLYFYYDPSGSLYSVNWYDLTGGTEVKDIRAHYKYNPAGQLISYIEYTVNDQIVYGDSIEIISDGVHILEHRFLKYEGEQYGWEPSDYFFNMTYQNNILSGYEKIEYFRFEDEIFQVLTKNENVKFYDDNASILFKTIFGYNLLDSESISKKILSTENALTSVVTSPIGFDKYYYNYDTGNFDPAQKSVPIVVNGDLVVKIYANVDTVNLITTNIIKFNNSKVSEYSSISPGSDNHFVYAYNQHGRLGGYVNTLNGVENSTGDYEYVVDAESNLIQFVREESSLTTGRYKDRYEFFYNEIIILSTNTEDHPEWKVSPNPASDILILDGPVLNSESGAEIKIFNSLGMKVYEASGSDTSFPVNISAMDAGIYFISIQERGRRYLSKFIKI